MTGIEPVLILLVEDEPLVRMVAHDALEAGGFSVIDAIDGNEAIAILDDRAHDLAGLISSSTWCSISSLRTFTLLS